ncbi:hypothetical protein GCM10011289_25020 [Paludibacterium paludis]|uniref:DUF1871 family protein n=2 Tax=Paludibacterium paludis TaxID=1225769 RepID=A0A918P4I9_9NEIS|nr:hypothetical protein GCM10011289_25020 [Paludibacterium paludis]
MSSAIEQARALHQKIKSVLMRDWDPIGVQAIPEAEDEYDSYVPTLYSMLISRKPVSEVFEYLAWLETEHMGLTVDRQRTLSIAEKLIDLA